MEQTPCKDSKETDSAVHRLRRLHRHMVLYTGCTDSIAAGSADAKDTDSADTWKRALILYNHIRKQIQAFVCVTTYMYITIVHAKKLWCIGPF